MVCLLDSGSIMALAETVTEAGGVGVVIVNDRSYGDRTLFVDLLLLPGTDISYTDGLFLSSYMNSTKSATISAPTTRLGLKHLPTNS